MFIDEKEQVSDIKNFFITSIISGALAGTCCDLIFFPLDTLKTRLQSQHGFRQSGGFKKLYRGVVPVLLGSAPNGSVFILTYDGFKEIVEPFTSSNYHAVVHMGAATIGEMASCLIRVPVEVIKQRKQAFLVDSSPLGLRTLYRGYGSTLLRDVPCALIQLPLWEYFKLRWQKRVTRECTPIEAAACGAASGAVSAVLTSPLDVAKTRIMLSSVNAAQSEVKIYTMIRQVYRNHGIKGLFAGLLPRFTSYILAGFVFFGIYERVKLWCIIKFPYNSTSPSRA